MGNVGVGGRSNRSETCRHWLLPTENLAAGGHVLGAISPQRCSSNEPETGRRFLILRSPSGPEAVARELASKAVRPDPSSDGTALSRSKSEASSRAADAASVALPTHPDATRRSVRRSRRMTFSCLYPQSKSKHLLRCDRSTSRPSSALRSERPLSAARLTGVRPFARLCNSIWPLHCLLL
jgi:hypothetical protein